MTRKGVGSVYQLKSGSWRGAIDIGYQGGKRKRATATGRTKTEVTDKLKTLQARAASGTLTPLDSESLAAYLYEWLESTIRPHRANRTYVGYELAIRKHILDELGATKLHNLTPQAIQRFVADLMRTEGNNTAKYTGKLLRNALNKAVRWGLIQNNPMNMVDLPTVRPKETQIWTAEQARNFLCACQHNEWGPLFIVILTLALRKGEALALQWGDIDLERRTISIKATLDIRNATLVRKPPKTPNSTRTLHLPELAVGALTKAQEARNSSEWVFHSRTGSPIWPQTLVRSFRVLVSAANVPLITIHGLRHTTATMLLNNGSPIHAVSKFLGHSSVSMTLNTYAHLLSHSHKDLAGDIDAGFGPLAT